MAQSATAPNPFAVDPADELPVGLQLDTAPAGADRHRPPPRRRAPAQRPPAGRVGGGQPEHGPRRLRRARSDRAWSRASRAAGPSSPTTSAPRRSSRRSPPRRSARPHAAGLVGPRARRGRPRLRRDPRRTSRLRRRPGGAATPAGLDPAEAEAIAVRRELRRQIGVLEAELADFARDVPARHADRAARHQRPRGRGRGARADPRHARRASSRRRAAPPSAAPARRPAARSARQAAAAPGRPGRWPGRWAGGGRSASRDWGPAGPAVRGGGEHGHPHRAHPRLGAASAVPLRRGAGRADRSSPSRLCWLPLLISTFALNLGAPGLQAAGPLQVFGSLDRLGGFFVLTAIRWIGPIVTAVVVGGVAGTAITADLGARKIREELDALQVLGVDPIKNLVVPRFLSLVLVTALLDVFAIVFGLARRDRRRADLPPEPRWLLRDALLAGLGDRRLGLGA